MKEGWEKENIEKSKEVLKDHFERKKQEEMTKGMIRDISRLPYSTLTPLHSGIGWDIESTDFNNSKNIKIVLIVEYWE